MLCAHQLLHLLSPLFKVPLSVCLSRLWGNIKRNIQRAAMLNSVLAALDREEKIYPITSKLWWFYTNAWLPADASLLSSWDKLSQTLNRTSLFTHLPFSLSSAVSTGLKPFAHLSAHWRRLLNSLHMIFFYWTHCHLLSQRESLLPEVTTGCFSTDFQDQTIELGRVQSLLTFVLGIQTSPGLPGCLPLNFLSVSMRSGSLPLLWPASSCSQSFPFPLHDEQLFLLIIPASSNYQQSMPQATLITEITRMLRNQLGGPLCLLICLLLQVLFLPHPTPMPLLPSWHIL